ncbi:gamma-glutamyl-gamma-aminobutyrate hydrolase family protein [Bacillus cereus]|uniref:gamma-glutamyl-gamma-aminobutyrate hydrolase family protein n=1 Tax=Bacillus cereus TaxID=1396 RepID=UPI0009528FC8|nr:gamma-glutamyl-gamma-aminobutyrate hydrolase family protein [Bacillus cereus]OLR26830.1 gamma-glutamyl-gamma-aminobutyrate hydrolase [Bacillus cereus]
MKKKPIIGISASVIIDSGGIFPGYRRSYVNEDYVNSVLQNGGIPFIIPVHTNMEVIKKQISLIDGLILSGGHDVSPFSYNEEPQQKLGDIFPERDYFDFSLIKIAKNKNIPILGICRGAQIINVYHGGTMYQDLSYMEGDTLKHWQVHTPELATHSIYIKKYSMLHSILGEEKLAVNSFHHQTIKEVPSNFEIVATAKDSVIEAIECKDYAFLLGIQWHPEMLYQNIKVMNNLFSALINKAQ